MEDMDIDNEDPQTMLASAIKHMDMELAHTFIVENDMKPEGVDKFDMLLFAHRAALQKDKPLLRRLFQYDKSLSGKVLWRVLDNVEVATILVHLGADITVPLENSPRATLLHVLAASNDPNKLALAELMIDKGADVSIVDENGHSVLQYAINGGASNDFIRKVIWNSVADFEKNALAIGDSDRCAELMPLLISFITSNSVDETTRSKRVKDAISLLTNNLLFPISEPHQMPINFSSIAKRMPLLLSFIRSNLVDERTRSSLRRLKDLLASKLLPISESRRMAVAFFLKHIMSSDMLDDTFLKILMCQKDFKMVEEFLKRGADPQVSLLCCALKLDESSGLALMIKYGADIHQQVDQYGNRPIHVASKHYSLDNVLLLVRLGVDVNVVNEFNLSPLSFFWNSSLHQNPLYAFLVRRYALAAFNGAELKRGVQPNLRDMELFNSSLLELQKLKRIEATTGIPYHSFLVGKVTETSKFTTRDDVINSFENQPYLKNLFPYYFCDLRNAYVFAKKIRDLELAQELLHDIVFEIYKISLPDLVTEKIFSYLPINEYVLDIHSITFPSTIWEMGGVEQTVQQIW